MAAIRNKMATIKDEMEITTFNEINNAKNTEPDSLNIAVLLSVIYGIIFIMGVLGNITTCIVIRRNRTMNTATKKFMFCLAISDLLLLTFGLPLEVYRLWVPFSNPLEESSCIGLGLISEMFKNAVVLTITAFTIEKYIVICHPLIAQSLFKLFKEVKYIIAIWICSLCYALALVMHLGIVMYEENGNMLSACIVKGKGVHEVFVIYTFVFFVSPMSVTMVLYVLIGIKMHTSRVLHPANNSSIEDVEQSIAARQYRHEASQRKVIRMLVAVTISYILCWAPFHLQRLLAIYGKNLDDPTNTFYKVYVFLKYLSGVLYYVSAAINPILYNIMSTEMRNAFKITVSSWYSRRGISRLGSTYSRNILADLRERAAARALQRSHPPLQRTPTTASSQQYDESSPEPQSPERIELSIIYEVNESELSSTSPQISSSSYYSSSIPAIDQELSCEELSTYYYQVIDDIKGELHESYV